jgi:purine-binding chemotaxis protein CheW
METLDTTEAAQQYLTFLIGQEHYAISILKVREILEYRTLTRVPMTLACIRGVMNLRGTVVPVVDLAAKFGLPEATLTRKSCIAIVEVHSTDGVTGLSQEHVLGVLVDAVNQVVELAPSEIQKAPAFGTPIKSEFICGLAPLGDRLGMVLDSDRLLSTEELVLATASPRELPCKP